MPRSSHRSFPFLLIVCLAVLAASGYLFRKAFSPQASKQVSGAHSSWIGMVQQRISTHPPGTIPTQKPVLRVVYFTPADAQPQANHQQRITKIMLHINAFLKAEMNRNELPCEGLPLEMENGLLKLHEVQGAKPASSYTYESGDETEAEMRAALKGTIDFDKEFVLALYSMCTKNPDGSYFFYAPYYGKSGSNQISGLCHAADCELLTPEFLTNTKAKIVYKEHYGDFTKTLADFNTAYIGGIAHELGHGLSLPHDSETPEEKQTLGTSLMGSGNLTYAREAWQPGPGQGSFLTLATSLRLATHPLATGGTHHRFQSPQALISEVKFTTAPGTISLQGTMVSSISGYAAIAYVDPDMKPGGYDAVPYCAEIQGDTFQITAKVLQPGPHELRITVLHLNGATTSRNYRFMAGKDLLVNAANLNNYVPPKATESRGFAMTPDSPAEVISKANSLLKSETNPATKQTIQELITSLKAPAADTDFPDPATHQGPSLILSDARWQSATVGWGQPMRNRMGSPSVVTGPFLLLKGTFYSKGLYAHTPSNYTFWIGKQWTTFEATAGLHQKDSAARQVQFLVLGDGKELYRSGFLTNAKVEQLKLNVTGVDRLELITEKGPSRNQEGWAVWGNPRIIK